MVLPFEHRDECLPWCDEHPAHLGPCCKPGKDRDCEGELNDAESASKASLDCMKQMLPQSPILIAKEPVTCSVSHGTLRRQSSARLEALVSPASTERAAAGCSAATHTTVRTMPASSVVSQHLLCSSSLQMPYLLLNPSMPEMRPRMYPVFFGESIEVSPEPVQEIRYRWDGVGTWGFLSFSWCFSFCKKLKCVYK